MNGPITSGVPVCLLLVSVIAADDKSSPSQAEPKSVILTGTITQLGPVVQQHYGLKVDDDFAQSTVVLVTASGQVHPLLKDVRSGMYFLDQRVRDQTVELHGRQYPGLPFIQVIDVIHLPGGQRTIVDYWCEVCAIWSFEPGRCYCCQDEAELRKRPVTRGD